MPVCVSKRTAQGGLTWGAHCPRLVVIRVATPSLLLGVKCHLSQFQGWSSPLTVALKGSAIILYLVQASHHRGFPDAQMVKNPPAMQETQV